MSRYIILLLAVVVLLSGCTTQESKPTRAEPVMQAPASWEQLQELINRCDDGFAGSTYDCWYAI